MLVFIDTEFTSLTSAQLLSIGLVTEAGDRFYGEMTNVSIAACSDFVRPEVLPLLGLIPPTAEGSTHVVASALNKWLSSLAHVGLVIDFVGDLTLLDDLLGQRHPSIAAVVDAGPLASQSTFSDAQDRVWRAHANMRHHALIDAMALAEGWRALMSERAQQDS
ncbi:3'-5' exoribonuclease [Niveibacterium sp. COAC-50]|uniref:3'-5' exoribonuclease n=1 Tax=Niveibacterium sp. COAC-50 TaxID=2729384 RepID=UPI0015570F4B